MITPIAFAAAQAMRRGLRIGVDLAPGIPPVGAVPFSITLPAPTAHQITVVCPLTESVPSTATVELWYRAGSSGPWLRGKDLYHMTAANSALVSRQPYFGGAALDVQPGTAYEIRLDYRPAPGAAVVSAYANTTTRALAPQPPANATRIIATPAMFAGQNLTLAAGTVLEIPAGDFVVPNGMGIVSNGTPSQPVYIVSAPGGRATVKRTWQAALDGPPQWAISMIGGDWVIDGINIEGRGVDSGVHASSRGILLAAKGGVPRNANITMRNIVGTGLDVFFRSANDFDNGCAYNNDLTGNNPASLFGVLGPDGYEGQDGWNDTAFHMPGEGMEVFNNVVRQFGDGFKCGGQVVGGSFDFYVHHNIFIDLLDDPIEADEAGGPWGFYCNDVFGAATAGSADVTYGGPGLVQLNKLAHIRRHYWKFEDRSFGLQVCHNTIHLRARVPPKPHALMMPGNANPIDWEHRGNLQINETGNDSVAISSGQMPGLVNKHNAYTSDVGITFGFGLRNATLAAAKIARPGLHDTDLIAAGPVLATAITLPASYTAPHSGGTDYTLHSGSNLRHAGQHIPGVTNGHTGAAPHIGAIIDGVDRGVIGLLPITPVPAWMPAASATDYKVVVLTKANGLLANNFREVCPSWHSAFRFHQIAFAYSGGALNPYYGTHGAQFLNGGGHAGTDINSTVALVAGQTQCQWKLIADGTKIFGDQTSAAGKEENSYANFTAAAPYAGPDGLNIIRFTVPVDGSYVADGQLGSTHSYNGLVVRAPTGPSDACGTLVSPVAMVPGRNAGLDSSALVAWKMPIASTSQSSSAVLWSKFAQYPNTGNPTFSNAAFESIAPPQHTCFDEISGRYFVQGRKNGVGVWMIDAATNQFSISTGAQLDVTDMGVASHMAVHIPERRLWVLLHRSAATGNLKIKYMDLSAAQPGWVNAGATPSAAVAVGTDWCCAAWAAPRGRIVIGDVLSSKAVVHELTLPATAGALQGTWSMVQKSLTLPDGTPQSITTWISSNGGGDNGNVYGKWAYNAAIDGFLFAAGLISDPFNTQEAPVYGVRLPSA